MSQVFYESDIDFTFSQGKPLVLHNCLLETEVLPHWHAHIELIYPMEGTLELTINSETMTAQSGELIIINPQELHSIKVLDGTTATYRCLIMDKDFFISQQFDYSPYLFPATTTNAELIKLYEQLIQLFDQWELAPSSQPVSLLMIKSYMMQLLGELITILEPTIVTDKTPLSSSRSSDVSNIEAVKTGIDYIRRHYQTPLQLDDICRAVGMSKYHFCRTFKKVTNQTVNQYITQSRCMQAQYILQQTHLTISECAEACGYTDPSYFSKIYKKTFGYLPSEEKRLHGIKQDFTIPKQQ